MMSEVDQIPVLQFSADPTHDYYVQASTDMVNWSTIGMPVKKGTSEILILRIWTGASSQPAFIAW